MTSPSKATGFFVAAGVAGLLHALSSLYWAAGGTLLLDTVGQWAVQWKNSAPTEVSLLLYLIGIAKLAAALIPILNNRKLLPWPKLWRFISWIGASVIVLWGLVNAVGAWAQLIGLVPITDLSGTIGHALLWDPLFVIWGVLLLIALLGSREKRRASPS